jgi:hypothetical protein
VDVDQKDKRSEWGDIDAAWEEVTPPPAERAGPALTADDPVPPVEEPSPSDSAPAAEEVPTGDDLAPAADTDTDIDDGDEEYFVADDTMLDVAGRTVSYEEQSVPQEVAEFLEQGQPVEVVVPAPEEPEAPEPPPPQTEEPQFQPVVDDLLGKPEQPPTFELVPVDDGFQEEERYVQQPPGQLSPGPEPPVRGSAWVLLALALLTALCIAGVVYVGFCT